MCIRIMMTPVEEKIEEKSQVKTGMVRVSDGKSRPRPARLVLTMETITVQREAPVNSQLSHTVNKDKGNVPNARERMVQLTRQKVGGLGLSIKGGAEHKLPILISKIYKDQAADQTGQLFVGDAVIKVNGEFITACPHDDAVNILKNAGDIVVLTVKHYRAATPFLQKQRLRSIGWNSKTCMTENVMYQDQAILEFFLPTIPGKRQDDDGTASDTDSSTGDEHPSLHNKQKAKESSHNNNQCVTTQLTNGGWQMAPGATEQLEDTTSRPDSATGSVIGSRPASVLSDCLDTGTLNRNKNWIDIVTVPLLMAYVTRYVCGTDKLRAGAFEVRAPRAASGVLHCDEPAPMSAWLKAIADNIVGLTNLQMKLFNRNFPAGERIEYMGWVHEGVMQPAQPWQTYKPKFLMLKGTDVMLFDEPPLTVQSISKCPEILKVYQTMFRMVKESETVDWRQHCFLVQASGGAPGTPGPRYFSVETRQDLLRVEASWTAAIVNSVIRLGKKTFTVLYSGRAAGLTLDWSSGFSLSEGTPGAAPIWSYRFSQLRGSSDDGKSKLKLHFQDAESRAIETKELECQILQSLLFCMHAFLTAKVASVDPAFLASIQQTN